MKNRLPVILLVLFGLAFMLFLIKNGIAGNRGSGPLNTGKLTVVASFYPLAEFAGRVGGNRVSVVSLTPAGVEPHDFEPTPQDLVAIENADVFIYNGAGLEPWVEKVLPDIRKKKTVVVQGSKGIELLAGRPEGQQNKTAIQAYYDPHIWLDPVHAQKIVENIRAGLAEADPGSASDYESNASSYENELSGLDADFRKGLTNCRGKDIVTPHNAFTYLARQYGLNVVSISGLSPDEEPSPQRLAEITDFVEKNRIRYIFFETLVNPRLTETIARETGTQTLVFNPLEGLTADQTSRGENYLLIQRQNLANLKIALECK